MAVETLGEALSYGWRVGRAPDASLVPAFHKPLKACVVVPISAPAGPLVALPNARP
jgi:hypothetical protein